MKAKWLWVRCGLYALLMAGCAAVLLAMLLPIPEEETPAAYVPAAKPAEVHLLEGLPADHILNSGDLKALDDLPGIGEALAQRIIDSREAEGLFFFAEDLLTVSGIGEGKLNTIIEHLKTLNQP